MSELLSKYISPDPEAKVVVLFGGNPHKRDFVVRDLSTISGLSVYGTLSEEDGYEQIKALPKTDLVLIGGRYLEEQRIRIRAWVKAHLPGVQVTEPGIHYPYETEIIREKVRQLISQ